MPRVTPGGRRRGRGSAPAEWNPLVLCAAREQVTQLERSPAPDDGPRPSRAPYAREESELGRERAEKGGNARLAHLRVLLAVTPADPDPAHHFAVGLDGKSADEDGELAWMHGLDAEGFVARQGRTAGGGVELVGGASMTGRGEGLGDGDFHPGEARARHAMKGDGMTAVVADADGLQDADLLGLRLRGVQDDARVLQGEPLDGDHAVLPSWLGFTARRPRYRRPRSAPDRSRRPSHARGGGRRRCARRTSSHARGRSIAPL